MSDKQKLLELISQVETICPQQVDSWQTMAVIESLGYTDRIIKEEFGFADVKAIGEYIYQQHQPALSQLKNKPHISKERQASAELLTFLQQFFRSFVYAIPLLTLLLLGNTQTEGSFKFLPPQLAALFTIATLASLITSGGFVQAIARRGEFYLGLGFSVQARQTSISLLGLGITATTILALVGLWFGFYRGLFADEYLVIAAGYYWLLSILWMELAILAIQWVWGTPITLVSLTGLFLILKLNGLGALEAQVVATFVIAIALSIFLAISFKRQAIANPADTEVPLPLMSATVYLLAPFFGYGVLYFAFIFCDRLVAGWAVSPASGLIFAIDSAYQRGMDLALINFLLLVPAIEYLAYKLIVFWYEQATTITFETIKLLSKRLLHRYILIAGIAVLFFIVAATITVGVLTPKPWATANLWLTSLGCLGYLLLSVGLLNAIVLFSLNLPYSVFKSLFPSLLLNLLIGYIAANAIAPEWAVLGLVCGSTMFVLLSRRQVLQAIYNPDYAYYLGGY